MSGSLLMWRRFSTGDERAARIEVINELDRPAKELCLLFESGSGQDRMAELVQVIVLWYLNALKIAFQGCFCSQSQCQMMQWCLSDCRTSVLGLNLRLFSACYVKLVCSSSEMRLGKSSTLQTSMPPNAVVLANVYFLWSNHVQMHS